MKRTVEVGKVEAMVAVVSAVVVEIVAVRVAVMGVEARWEAMADNHAACRRRSSCSRG